jgi:hypothetical protein
MAALGTSSLRASWPVTSGLRASSCPTTSAAARLARAPRLAPPSPPPPPPRAPRRAAAPKRASATKKADDGLDPVERAVAFLFGKKALEDEAPMGLKRLNFETMPDQKVETERLAAPLAGDSADVARLVRPLLAGTQLEREPLARVYDTDAGDEWTPAAFHAAARARGAALVLCVTEAGSLCGGYNPLGFLGFGDEHATPGAFLFAFVGGTRPVKLPKIGGASLAVIDAPNEGPRFGAEGLSVPLQPPDARACRSRLGTYYARLPKGDDAGRRSVFLAAQEPDGAGRKARLARLAVFVAEEAPGYRLDAGSIVWRSSGDGAAAST